MASRKKVQEFYDTLQTLPKLIGDLALSIAEAQRRMDQNYIESLAAFSKIILESLNSEDQKVSADQYMALYKSIAPSRYQFTETVVEVRADLQMTQGSEVQVSGEVGIETPLFAATVNASYARRSAYDYQAAALIRTTLNAVPADPGVMDTLLKRGGEPSKAEFPSADRYKALKESLDFLPKPAPPAEDEAAEGEAAEAAAANLEAAEKALDKAKKAKAAAKPDDAEAAAANVEAAEKALDKAKKAKTKADKAKADG